MTDTAPTMTHTATFALTAFASRRDGTSAGDMLDLIVSVEFQPVEQGRNPSEQVVDHLGEWLGQYLASRDLTDVLDFPPTAYNVATWVSRVAEQFAGPTLASVSVTDRSDSRVARTSTVRYGVQ